MRSTRLLVLAAVVAALGAVPFEAARADSGTQTVAGVVTYAADGTPAVNAVVWSPDASSVAAVHTDSQGNYTLTLPSGVHEVRASTAGCTDPGDATVDLTLADQTQDFSLTARPNDFGLKCTTEPFAWIDATTARPLRGRGVPVARASLGLRFHFAGTVYYGAKISTAGQVLLPKLLGVPTLFEVLLENLMPGYADSVILTSTTGVRPNRTFTAEWRDFAVVNTPGEHMTYELQLHENGAIDMLYQTTGPSQTHAPRAISQSGTAASGPSPFILGPYANDSPPLDGMALHLAPSL
jgi:hypothetical protein